MWPNCVMHAWSKHCLVATRALHGVDSSQCSEQTVTNSNSTPFNAMMIITPDSRYCLTGLEVRCLWSSRPKLDTHLPCESFSRSSHTGITGSALGLVGPVSVYFDWVKYKIFVLQLLSQCGSTYNCPCRAVPEIHSHVTGTLSNQQTTTTRFYLSDLIL